VAVTSSWVVEVDERTFDQEVIQRSRESPVVVDFWAPWCGPCRMLAPALEKVVAERKGEVVLAKINIDENPHLASQFGIQSIPTVIAFRDGQPVLDFLGLLPEAQLREFLDRIVPSEADRLAHQAAALEKTNPVEAEKLYRRALAGDRNQEAAQVGLARLLISQAKDAEARELLQNLGPGSALGEEVQRLQALLELRDLAYLADDATARERLEIDPNNAQARYELGCVLASQGRYEEALQMLLSAAERDRKLAATKVREAMVKVFQAVGVRSPLADEYRDKLSSLLY
jgi:putative thioredoxin